jgi:hypothetical protein
MVAYGGAGHDLKEVLQAAFHGRIAKLFAARNGEKWGVFDPDTGDLRHDEEPVNGNEDLIDRAVVETIRHRGDVFVVEPERVPGGDLTAGVGDSVGDLRCGPLHPGFQQ